MIHEMTKTCTQQGHVGGLNDYHTYSSWIGARHSFRKYSQVLLGIQGTLFSQIWQAVILQY